MAHRAKLRPNLRLGAVLLETLWSMGRMTLSRRPHSLLSPWCRRLLARMSIETRLESPLPTGGQLWVANHLSWLDPMVLLALRPCGILAKAEVAGYPVIGSGARRVGLRFVRREEPLSRAAALAQLASDLRAGRDFLIFPEGTTTRGEILAPLYEGSLRLAYRLGVTVLPIHLASEDAHYPWTGQAELLPHLQGLCAAPRTRVRVRPGPVLHPTDYPNEGTWIRQIRGHLHPWNAIEESA